MEILRSVYMWWVILDLNQWPSPFVIKGGDALFLSIELIAQKDWYIILVFYGDIKKCLYVVGDTGLESVTLAIRYKGRRCSFSFNWANCPKGFIYYLSIWWRYYEILRSVYMWWVILDLMPATLAIRYKGRRCSFSFNWANFPKGLIYYFSILWRY